MKLQTSLSVLPLPAVKEDGAVSFRFGPVIIIRRSVTASVEVTDMLDEGPTNGFSSLLTALSFHPPSDKAVGFLN